MKIALRSVGRNGNVGSPFNPVCRPDPGSRKRSLMMMIADPDISLVDAVASPTSKNVVRPPNTPRSNRTRKSDLVVSPSALRLYWVGRVLMRPAALVCGCAVLFVGSDVLERHLLPDLSTGWRHFLLTARSAVVIGIGCAIVYELMRRLHDQWAEKEKMAAVGRLAAGIAHEINNPLSSISSIVQLLKRHRDGALDLDQLNLLHRHIERIAHTVRTMSTLSRPAFEHWEYTDLSVALDDAVSLVSFDPRSRGIHIDFAKPQNLPRTWAVPGQIQQVFLNLLLNALDAMPGGGGLGVRAEADPRRLLFAISDTGCGIPPDIGRRVFEPFFTTKEPGMGTGLGLSVSFGIVQKHGGRVDFTDRKGGGTTFTVELPVMKEPSRL